jgi:hypothetical protein
MGELLREEWVPRCPLEDEFSNFRTDVSVLQYGLHQLSAGLSGELIQTDLAIKGFAAPWMGIFRSVKKDQQDMRTGQPPDQII